MDITYLNPKGVVESYTDNADTPVGWERKLTEMRRGINYEPKYPSYDVFDPKSDFPSKDNETACDKLYELKKEYCDTTQKYKCTTYMPNDKLQSNHDKLMKCRNIRAIENQANCRFDKDRWLENDESGHADQIYSKGNGAFKCMDIYLTRNKLKQPPQKSAPRSKRSTSDRRRSTSRSNSDKRRSKSGRWRRPKRKSKSRKSARKRTPSRKMK